MNSKVQDLRHFLYRIKVALWYKSKVGKLFRSLTWTTKKEGEHFFKIFEQKWRLFDTHQTYRISDERIKKLYEWENKTWSFQWDQIYIAKGDIIIEPQNGLAFTPERELIVQTRGHSHQYLVPSLYKVLKHKYLNGNYTEYEELIHFDGFVSKNLYHFFDDALNPLLMLIQANLAHPGTPILIHEKIYSLHYVQYFLSKEPFKNLNWIVQQHGEWIKTKKMIKSICSSKGWIPMYDQLCKNLIKNPFRKVFLNRKAKFQRRLTNNQFIESYLAQYGFEIIYAEDLTYVEQIKTFSETKYLVALHGAGITNLLHSELTEVHLLEIFSESLIHPHYYWLLELNGIKYYDAIAGTRFDANRNFHLDESFFKQTIQKMLRM